MISVCMAAYNGEKYIEEQISSILPEIGPEDELIVSDDGSTDSTVAIIQKFVASDTRVKLIKNTTHSHGTRGNSVNALSAAKGDIIFLADQDDIWIPGKVEKMLSALPGYDCVHHDSIITDDTLTEISPSLYALEHNGPGVIKNMKHGTFYGSHMVITRKLLDCCFPFPENDEVGHDLWIGLVASMRFKINYINDKLIYYRRHEGVHCDLFNPSKRSLSKKLYGRIVMAYYILRFAVLKPTQRM